MNYYIAKALNKFNILKKISTEVPRKINGATVTIPLLNGIGIDNLHVSEMWMCQLLTKIIAVKPGTFVDVGVNVGQTLIKLRTVSKFVKYVGFEPNPRCVYYCNVLIDINRFEHCQLIPAGLFDKDTVLSLNLYSDHATDASASLIENFRPVSKVCKKIHVPVYRFENVTKALDIDNLAIIKIDVEGAELEVLESLQASISNNRPILLMEILPCYSNDNTFRRERQEKIEQIIKQLDYKMIRILKKGSESIGSLEVIHTIGIHGNMELCDYVFSPAELTSQILSEFKMA